MSTKPILFSTPMVQAILVGRKTMTRRVIKPQTVTHSTPGGMMVESLDDFMHRNKEDFELLVACAAPYQPGDVLWVRETCFCWVMPMGERLYRYRATDPDGNKAPSGPEYDDELVIMPWTPSIYMPREAARLFLRVTDVRVEKVQDIGADDAYAEGYHETEPIEHRPRSWFSSVWDACYAKRGYGWDSNPFCWVISFERVNKDEAMQ